MKLVLISGNDTPDHVHVRALLIYIVSEITLIQPYQTKFTVSSVRSNFMTGSTTMNVCPHC